MHRSTAAVSQRLTDDQSDAFRDLYRQQSDRIWHPDKDIDWSRGPQIPADTREPWLRMLNAFLGLEQMGLDTIQVMMSKATHKLRDPNLNLYLAAQAHDEARHAYVLDRYLTLANGHGRLSRPERVLIARFGDVASMGFYRVENWLTSTLFSENFAALFLQKAVDLPTTDPLAKDIFRLLLRDEVRHVNFLHTILPSLLNRLSLLGRAYLWQSQVLMVGAVSIGMRRLRNDAGALGIDIHEFKRTFVENLEAQFRDAGLDTFLHARTYGRIINTIA